MLAANLRIGIPYARQIRGPRARIQFLEQAVIARLRLELRNAARLVVDVAEDDRFRGARLLARGDDFAVVHGTILFFGLNLRRVDALHAVGALFHHAAAADGDVRIPHAVQARRRVVGEEQEVKTPDLVRAIVRAVARADAAVVRHVVQPFGAVRCGTDGADVFAGRVFALHAGHRLVIHFRIVEVAAEVSVDADPLHDAAAHHLFLTDHGDVVLRLAGDDAGVAADAAVQIDRHAPRIAVVFISGINRKVLGLFFFGQLGKVRVLAELVHRRDADEIAREGVLAFLFFGVAFDVDRVLLLHRRETVLLVRLFDSQAGGDPGRRSVAQQVAVESGTGADLAGTAAAVAQVHGHGIIRVARHDEHARL